MASRADDSDPRTFMVEGTAASRRHHRQPQVINMGGDDELEICGFQRVRWRVFVTWVCIVATLGFLRLVFYWKPNWMLRCTHVAVDLGSADHVLLKDQYQQTFVETVKQMSCRDASLLDASREFHVSDGDVSDGQTQLRYFTNKKIKYFWNYQLHTFQKLEGLGSGLSCSFFHQTTGLNEEQQSQKRVRYGENIILIRVTPIVKLLLTQALNPFYVFQVFSIILWCFDEYYYYAGCIFVISTLSLSMQVYETRKMQRALKSTVTAREIVTVLRANKGEYEDVESDMLVPGDIIEVPRRGCIMQCDAVLIAGNCIVNESMLTGESIPVTKTPIPNPQTTATHADNLFDIKEHSRHTLFCGTHVIQARYYGDHKVRAVVLRTGFSTSKGELIRSIMFPKPVDFKFSQDSFKFIGVLALISLIGMIYTLVLMVSRGNDPGEIVKRTLDLVTIVIPPALPAAMTVGIVFAQKRLKAVNIFCISPRTINLCGAINSFCFDKTGTLTEDGLDMWGVQPVKEARFETVYRDASQLRSGPLLTAMATCHSLTIVEGQLTGDPLDLKMFESTGWELEEPGEDTARFDVFMPTIVRPKTSSVGLKPLKTTVPEVGIVRQFVFSSRLQRMSVVARNLDSDHFDLYVKGAPEMIVSLCKPETVGEDFHSILRHYTQQGYRVLALATRSLHKMNYVKVQRVQREQVECDLTLLGLLILENRLKPETTPIIEQLKEANIRTVMVTGDNMLTAVSVARDCKILDKADRVILVHVLPPANGNPASLQWTYAEDSTDGAKELHVTSEDSVYLGIDDTDHLRLAVTGTSWRLLNKHFPELVNKVVVKGAVFARMAPDQKQQLVECMQSLGYYVGMCGDGANDCGALKTAHAGISLSEAEASVASPFTSKVANISCVPTVIREGRAALVTSFGVFKYMACYSLTQFTSVCLLYWVGANLTDFTFLYIDLFLLTTLAMTFCYTRAYPELVPQAPAVSLISVQPIISIITQCLVMLLMQVIIWVSLRNQPWFEAFVPNDELDFQCYEVTAVFCVSAFQYITLAIVLSKSTPYRGTIFSNYAFMINVLICLLVTVYACLYPMQWIEDLMELRLPPKIQFRVLFVGLAAVNFFICFLLETYVVDSHWVAQCLKTIQTRLTKKKHHYEIIEEEIKASSEWPPPVASSTYDNVRLPHVDSVNSYNVKKSPDKDVNIQKTIPSPISDAVRDMNKFQNVQITPGPQKAGGDVEGNLDNGRLRQGTFISEAETSVV